MFSWVKKLKIYFFDNLNSILFLSIFNFILFCIHRNYNTISSLRKLNDFLFIISVFSLLYFFLYIFNHKIKNILSKFILIQSGYVYGIKYKFLLLTIPLTKPLILLYIFLYCFFISILDQSFFSVSKI